MNTKLTLKLDHSIIEQAKNYAKDKNTSLSKLIESYLGKLVAPEKSNDITPLVKSLSGVMDLPKDVDVNRKFKKYLFDKYSKVNDQNIG